MPAERRTQQRVGRDIGIAIGRHAEAISTCAFRGVQQRPECAGGRVRAKHDPAGADSVVTDNHTN